MFEFYISLSEHSVAMKTHSCIIQSINLSSALLLAEYGASVLFALSKILRANLWCLDSFLYVDYILKLSHLVIASKLIQVTSCLSRPGQESAASGMDSFSVILSSDHVACVDAGIWKR